MPQEAYRAETLILRRIVTDPDCRWIWTTHALEQMATRQISAPDVKCGLTNGHVTLHEQKKDLLWRVEGKDIDGNPITVIVAAYEETVVIKIVTAF